MSKFEITMKFLFDQDELSKLGMLTNGYKGEVMKIEQFSNKQKNKLPDLSLFLNHNEEDKPASKDKHDPARIEDVCQTITDYGKLGESKTRAEWTDFIIKKSGKNYIHTSVRALLSTFLKLGIFAEEEHYHNCKITLVMYMDSRDVRRKQSEMMRSRYARIKETTRLDKARKTRIGFLNETR